jgi:hypothetical protein
MVRHALCAAAIVVVALSTLACRREMPIPEPRGLGAADIAATQSIDK